jgi:hypothetical protein
MQSGWRRAAKQFAPKSAGWKLEMEARFINSWRYREDTQPMHHILALDLVSQLVTGCKAVSTRAAITTLSLRVLRCMPIQHIDAQKQRVCFAMLCAVAHTGSAVRCKVLSLRRIFADWRT